jgi:hypothetical protein
MIKSIGDNYKIYGLIIVKIIKKSLMLDYGFSNATFEPPNHVFALEGLVINNQGEWVTVKIRSK